MVVYGGWFSIISLFDNVISVGASFKIICISVLSLLVTSGLVDFMRTL